VIFHVRKVIEASKAAAKEKIFAQQLETKEIIQHVSQILGLFLDESIADDVAFSEVKTLAFTILERDKLTQVSQFLNNQSVEDAVFEWEFIAAFAPAFKQHLRQLLTQVSFSGHRSDDCLIEAITFLKMSFEKGKSLNRYRFDQIPKAFIPQGMNAYIYEEDEHGKKRIHPDKYEFLVYRLLRNHLEAGDIYVSDSLRFRSFEDDLIPLKTWQVNKEKILKEIDIPDLAKPMTVLLAELETELEAKYIEVNGRILSGENAHIKLTKRRGQIIWSLPYVRDEDIVNNPFFDSLQQINIAHLLQFVDSKDIQPTIHSTDTHGANQVNFAILSPFGYQFAPRYKDIRSKTDTLYGFKNPGDYDEKFLLKPTSKANTRLIIEEEDNIQHIFASLALKVTSQSVIIGKLSSYARKNRTKKALWELDNIRRSSYLLTYVDSPAMRRNVQRALNRGESYHKLRRAVSYAYSGRLRVKTELEQQIWADCSRLLANCVIYYNACILSELLERANRRGDHKQADQIKRISPVSWKHVNFYGQYDFLNAAGNVDLAAIVDGLEEINGGEKSAN
jgi:Tn3 transposase DDE domain